MAIAISVAAAYVNNDGGTAVTSGSFNVVTDDLLVVAGHSDEDIGTPVWVISDNQTPDLTYTEIARRDDGDGLDGAVIAWYHRIVSNITGLTITLTVTGVNVDSPAIKVYKITGYDTTTILGSVVEGNWTTIGQQTSNITAGTNGIGIVVATDWNETGASTSADTTETGFDTTGDISGMSGYRTLVSGNAENADMTSPSTPSGNYLWFEVREASAGGRTTKNIHPWHVGTNQGIGLGLPGGIGS